jgi:E3 ubiquitin-protein ligase HUWE1
MGGIDTPLALINDLITSLPLQGRHAHALHFQITQQGPRGEVREINIPLNPPHHHRDPRSEARRDPYLEPQQAVAFTSVITVERWQEEGRMLFGNNFNEKVKGWFQSSLLFKLVPPAIEHEKEVRAREAEEKRKQEEERKKREEEELKLKEAKDAEEKAAREKKEAEERERAEREAAEAAAAQAELHVESTDDVEQEDTEPQPMEGVESTSDQEETGEGPSETAQRFTTTIRGETIDITELGIDPEYLAALPEEFREEVIAQTVSSRRLEAQEAVETAGENTEVFQEFLEALPDDIREEIIQQERQERRRREREEQRRQAAASGNAVGPQEMDPASILLTFPPDIREEVFMQQGPELMDHLPPEMAAEARAVAQRRGAIPQRQPAIRAAGRDWAGGNRASDRGAQASRATDNKPQRRAVVQMVDKAGVATLLRLMFVNQQGTIRSALFALLENVCENRQNRLEVISTILQILHDGSTDMEAVERSFSQLSLKAKQPKDKDTSKTPGSIKRTLTGIGPLPQIQSNSEVSPLLIVQQCLDLLVELSKNNAHVPSLFLTEHETVASSLKRNISRKGKGKDVSVKAQRFAINSLLALLDRSLVMESSAVMQLLADLLNKVTYPLQAYERRRREAEEEAKKAEKEKEKAIEQPTAESEGAAGSSSAQPELPTAPSAEEQPVAAAESSTAKETKLTDDKNIRQIAPPVIPEHNLKLVTNIFVARECSSKTFQNTISTIKNLSHLPGTKRVFGEELVRQARVLSENIVSDLDELLPYILKAESGTQIQGVALAKFSPGASEQNKLLRVLTALDHLFDKKSKKSDGSPEDDQDDSKEDLLGSLYWNPTFGTMWEKLSACLAAIRQRESMLNVATILLPLIESLMVVCKNTTINDAPLSASLTGKDMLFSSPPPENRIAGLFFTFTEEHRRILNELVRNNPKLMSGTFSLLVKNPKVLEFDNKRNYFTRSIHHKAGNQANRPPYPSLQLQVRRNAVFHDSFKALYFKTGDEMKYGKLNIRFHGEEGVDAGGVTREWFQVLSRQMFDPNYALFIPVSSDRTTFHPNRSSSVNEEHLLFFKFIGRIIGKALYEGRVLDCYFSRAVYKRILGKPVSVKDMESFDPDYYKSLDWMLKNDITDAIFQTFSVEDEEFGVKKVTDLIPDGRNVPVTEDNKHDYVRLVVEHRLLSSVQEQMEHFLKGFHDIIPAELIAIFNEQELELLISGLPDIDVDDWKANTEYHNYNAASQQIQWFWRAVRSFDKEERAKLLQFVTGTSKVPLNGFKELEGMNGISRFNIHRDYGDNQRLPSSHTCFNRESHSPLHLTHSNTDCCN